MISIQMEEVFAFAAAASFLVCLMLGRILRRSWLSESSVYILVGFALGLLVYLTNDVCLNGCGKQVLYM